MPQIVAVASSKGGTSKTTSSVNLAGELSERGRVLLVDADEQDAGSAEWWVGDGEGVSFEFVKDVDPDHLARLRSATQYDAIVVDTAPAISSQALAAVAAVADLVVIPTRTAAGELVAAVQTYRAVTGGVVLFTQVDGRAMPEAVEAQTALRDAGLDTFDAMARSYRHHSRARDAHTTASGLSKIHAAAIDYRAIGNELTERLKKK